MFFRQVADEKLAQYAYLIGCQATGEAIVIDPERDIDRYIRLAEQNGLNIVAVADTHIHADYLSGLREFAERGVLVYASDEGGPDWTYEWLPRSDYAYKLLRDGDTFSVGNIHFRAVHSPGHTPEHLSYLVTDHGGGADQPIGLASGDFVFVGDLGRPDLLESAAGVRGAMEPAAQQLFQSVQRFLELEDYLQVWPAHGAGSACGKALGAIPETTVGYERRFNGAIQSAKRSEAEFVGAILDGQPEPPMYFARMKRDNRSGPRVLGTLPNPRLLSLEELGKLSGDTSVALVDARLNRDAFLDGHIPGSLLAPFNRTFNTVVGSFVDDETDLYLVIEQAHVEEAVRDLVRIGLDRVVGYATPDMLETFRDQGGHLDTVPRAHMDEIAGLTRDPQHIVLDVRNHSEWLAARVPESKNIAYTRLALRMDEVPENKTLLVHCMTGGRSSVAAAFLKRHGVDVVFLDGLFAEWVAAHEPAAGVAEATA
ncbi:MAG: MBL fold metallo-hydrolase [Rhodothermales bacterium]|nr:MBL fold metallo-hydrolase [Rhodothermales bacterium]MBO6778841.1 MBL fold metallo-hydrolase [Rhodothermales bacterium]